MKEKRHRSLSPEPCSSSVSKKPKFNVHPKDYRHGLLDMPDDILLHILHYLTSYEIHTISKCCQRLCQIAGDRTLWKRIDFSERNTSSDELTKYTRYLQPSSKYIAFRGDGTSRSEIDIFFLRDVVDNCKNLSELVIENYQINGNKIQITDFPKRLKKLSLEGTEIYNWIRETSYLHKIDLHMRNLTCLVLSKCNWFTSHSLMVISKIPWLKELRLNSCHGLGECVAYASLATRFGFKALEILDIRDTSLGDSEICCFSSTHTLTHMYLECPQNPREEQLMQQEIYMISRQPEELEAERDRLQQEEGIIGNDGVVHIDQAVQLVRVGNRDVMNRYDRYLVTDRAICTLGSYVSDRRIIDNGSPELILVEGERRILNNPNLKTLVVRNYPLVTDNSLRHLAENVSSLEYLDVTGTSVTENGIEMFKTQRCNVKVISSFYNEE